MDERISAEITKLTVHYSNCANAWGLPHRYPNWPRLVKRTAYARRLLKTQNDRRMFNLGNNYRSRKLVHEGHEPYASWRFVTPAWRAVAKCCPRIFRETFCHIASDRSSFFFTFIVAIHFSVRILFYCNYVLRINPSL